MGPIRFRDGVWHVRVDGDDWLQCNCEADAWEIAASLDTSCAVIDGDLSGDDAARKLDAVAKLLSEYHCVRQADWLRECAKLASEEPSCFDDMHID